MLYLQKFSAAAVLMVGLTSSAYALCPGCCDGMGGIRYCDSSAGRYVCQNGSYSSCYCTRHAVMGLEGMSGCCLWQGGVLAVDPMGLVICNNGGTSELCSRQNPVQKVAAW